MTTPKNRSRSAFFYATPIAILGGLIGFGGAEFRLPVLVGPLGYAAKQAVPLNLAVSFITLAASLAFRSKSLSLTALTPFRFAIPAIIGGAVVAAFLGASLAGKLSEDRLHRVVLWLLVGIGCLLIIEGFLPTALPSLVPEAPPVQIAVGIAFGLAIGLVSSLLGVAGGELIIPTLVFAFGADIKTAGTGSLLISLPTVAVGLIRYGSRGAFADQKPLGETVVPMGVGSIIGAAVGGMLVGIIPAGVLKVGLGLILNWSALKIFRKTVRR